MKNLFTVPPPRDLLIERLLSKSLVLSWSPPDSPMVPISQYHICIDGAVKMIVPALHKTKALLENVDCTNLSHRISIRAVSETGQSPDASCTITVGKGPLKICEISFV